MAIKSLIHGLAGNLSEQAPEKLHAEYGAYLMNGETIATGFTLIRDTVIFTDKRILFFDKQGATGKKKKVESINLFSIMSVTLETAGFGVDDSTLTITYLTNPFLASPNPDFQSKEFDFPKKYNIQSLYAMLSELAYENCLNVNKYMGVG